MVPAERLARWAAASIPRARPEATTNPAAPRWCASACASFWPAADALRDPTIATIGRTRAAPLPRTASSGGGAAMAGGRCGDFGSPGGGRRAARARVGGRSRPGFGAAPGGGGRWGAAAGRQIGQGRERFTRTAVMLDQRQEGPRPHVLAADQPQPVEPLVVVEANVFSGHLPPRAASPRRRRGTTLAGAKSLSGQA